MHSCWYRTKSDKRCIHVGTELSQIKGVFMLGFFLSFLYFFLRLVCFVLYLFVFDNRLISNFISAFSVLRI